jgi:hypothetical protein
MRPGFADFSEPLSLPGHGIRRFLSDDGRDQGDPLKPALQESEIAALR